MRISLSRLCVSQTSLRIALKKSPPSSIEIKEWVASRVPSAGLKRSQVFGTDRVSVLAGLI